MTYKEYWTQKMRPFKQAGILWETPVECPQDGLRLWTTAKEKDLREKLNFKRAGNSNSAVEVQTYFAICPNGHRHDL